jgi:foldase protein PrsA
MKNDTNTGNAEEEKNDVSNTGSADVGEQTQTPESSAAALADSWDSKPKRKIAISVKSAVVVALILVLGSLIYVYKGVFVAATINGNPISRLAVVKELEKMSGKATLDSLITRQLLADEAAKKGITVSADEVNAEIAKIEESLKSQNETLENALKGQNMTRADLENQIILTKKAEKLVADKIAVSDKDVDDYIANNPMFFQGEQDAASKEQIRERLKQQKFGTEVTGFIDALKAQASIHIFADFGK